MNQAYGVEVEEEGLEVLVRRLAGSGSGGRLSARMARARSLEFFSNLSFLSTLNMWTLDSVHKPR